MRHAEHSAASWQISILAYWHISNLLTMQHYKALFTLGIPIVIGQIGVIILGFANTLMIGHHSTNELAAASFVNILIFAPLLSIASANLFSIFPNSSRLLHSITSVVRQIETSVPIKYRTSRLLSA